MKIKIPVLLMASIAMSLFMAAPAQTASKKAKADEEMQAMMAKAKEAGTPGAEHAVLKPLEGNWTTTTKTWMKPGEKAQQSAGTSSFTWVLGGRFLKQDFKGNWGGQDFEGLGYLGYDKVKKQYLSIWMDSMSTGIAKATGQYDPAAKTITDAGSFSCPIVGGDMGFRAEWKFVDDGTMVYSMFMKSPTDPTSKEFKTMEITYQRAK